MVGRCSDSKIFYSIPNWLDLEGHTLPVIVTGKKPACWLCGEICLPTANCRRKKSPEKVPDHIHNPFSPPMANGKKGTPVYSIRTRVREKKNHPHFL